MAYLRTRAAVQAYLDSNAGQFARAGNPWDGEGELRASKSRTRRDRPNPVRRPERACRDADETFLNAQAKRDMAMRLAQLRGSRIARPLQPKPEHAYTTEIKPARDAELSPFHPAAIAAEQARLARATAQAKRDCLNVKLSALDEALVAYGEQMSAIFE